MARDDQYGPKGLVEPDDAAIQGAYNSTCEPCVDDGTEVRLCIYPHCDTALTEALAAKERAEAERDVLEKQCDGLRSTLFDADADYARLTSALADAREEAIWECAAIARDFVPDCTETWWSIEDAILALALAHPTTEPAKAEEPEDV